MSTFKFNHSAFLRFIKDMPTQAKQQLAKELVPAELRRDTHEPVQPRKCTVWNDSTTYRRYLERKGYRVLGKGAYSTVYSHPKHPERVLKVCNGDDDGWTAFAKWAATVNSPHLIKVFNVKHHEGFYVATMERVTPMASVRYKPGTSHAELRRRDELSDVLTNSSYCRDYTRPSKVIDMETAMKRAKYDYVKSNFGSKIQATLRLMQKKSLIQDLHPGNFGLREGGTVVIFDPVTYAPPSIEKFVDNKNWKRAA